MLIARSSLPENIVNNIKTRIIFIIVKIENKKIRSKKTGFF